MRPHFRYDFTFPRDYEVKVLESAPLPHPVEKLYHFPLEVEEGEHNGAYLRVQPANGAAWNGLFVVGFESPEVVNAICSCPHPDWLAVVAGGYAYLVNAPDPGKWLFLEQRPVMDVRSLSDQGLMLFTGFTAITAVGRDGVLWTTERLSWDGVKITGVEGKLVRGLGWDANSDKEIAFEVDLATGKHTGGSRPGKP